jgi:hypothetical protein
MVIFQIFEKQFVRIVHTFYGSLFMFSPMGFKNWNVVFLVDKVSILVNFHFNIFLWNFEMFHLLIYWYKDLGKQLLTRSFLLQMSFTLCESKIFISKIHGGPYIVDYEGLELKETWNYV